jgi:dTDP-4-dehydrorhamnose reductase
MKALVTGANGTVGAALRKALEARGAKVVAWDRSRVPVDQYAPMEEFVRATAPDVLFHLAIASRGTGKPNEPWLVNYEWPSELAWITRQLGVKFVFTSSVMVFTDNARGPFTMESQPDAAEGYGHQKRMAEQRVLSQNPNATVVRLGWQIGDAPGSNNMIDFFERQMKEHGAIRASTQWLPACSFLDDTAQALLKLSSSAPGLYMIDSNERWSFYEIATALNKQHGNHWRVRATSDFVYDQRMIDPRVNAPPLKARLKTLA